jgi:penicillin-binding protein 2
VAGEDVTLTIDLELQQIADNLLQGKKGAVIVMDAQTGRCWSQQRPAFDPNVFVDHSDRGAMNYYLTSDDAPLFNRVTSGQFPPGSIFKIVTASAACRPTKAFRLSRHMCAGAMRIGNRFFKCWSTHGAQDFNAAMAHSCDVFFINGVVGWSGSSVAYGAGIRSFAADGID